MIIGIHVRRCRPQPQLAAHDPDPPSLPRGRKGQEAHPLQHHQASPGDDREDPGGPARRRAGDRAPALAVAESGGRAGRAADSGAGIEARRRPALPAGDGGLHIGVPARPAGERERGPALRNHGLAARAPAEDREGAGREAPERGKPRALRSDFGLELQPDLLAGQSRILARRQDGAAADRIRSAVRRRRTA